MPSSYLIEDTTSIISPGLVVFYESMQENLQEMIRIAGGVERLRPHCKTHKMREVAELQVEAGITKHKCATFAEAEMLGWRSRYSPGLQPGGPEYPASR